MSPSERDGFLALLESRQRIQPSERVFEFAEQAGRKPSRVERTASYDDSVRAEEEFLVRMR